MVKDRAFQLTDLVRETAYAIHSFHGPGHDVAIYGNALAHRLKKQSVPLEQHVLVPIRDEDGSRIGDFIADMIVDGELLIVLRVASSIHDDQIAAALGYLRSCGLAHAAIVNFGGSKFQLRKLATHE